MVKAFLFDYDGVITAGAGDDVPALRLAHHLGIARDRAVELIMSVWDGFSTGTMDEAAAWQHIEAQYGQPISVEQRDIWYTWEELKPLPKMVSLVRELRAKGFPVGVASNVLPVTARVIEDNGGYDGFDFLVLSYQVGARKPDHKVYDAAMANLEGVATSDVLFLDDREKCTEAAQKLGMQAIHVTDQDKAIKQVRELAGLS